MFIHFKLNPSPALKTVGNTGDLAAQSLDLLILTGYLQVSRCGLASWFVRSQFLLKRLVGKYYMIYLVKEDQGLAGSPVYSRQPLYLKI